MNGSEMAVFAILGASVSVGLYQMGSDAMRVYRGEKKNEQHTVSANVDGGSKGSIMSAACPMNWGKEEEDR
jgi:hypothetical protein